MALTRDALVQYLEEKARVDLSGVEDDAELFSSGMIDSFAMVDLLVFLEKHTGTKMGPARYSCRSEPQTAASSTRTMTSVGSRSSGSATSSTLRSSGTPCRWKTTARICAPPLPTQRALRPNAVYTEATRSVSARPLGRPRAHRRAWPAGSRSDRDRSR